MQSFSLSLNNFWKIKSVLGVVFGGGWVGGMVGPCDGRIDP